MGGVEAVLEKHAEILCSKGHQIRVICGCGESRRPGIELVVLPELAASHPRTQAAQSEILQGESEMQFKALVDHLKGQFSQLFRGAQLVCIHNVLTMPFNLACTEALRQIAAEMPTTRFVAWIHDLAACNPDYHLPQRPPWELLRTRLPHFQYIAVSDLRRRQFATLTNTPMEECEVIPNGVAMEELFSLTPNVSNFLSPRDILSREVVLLCPARLLKRKNLELAIEIVSELKHLGPGGTICAGLITGACDPHNAQSAKYARHLRLLIEERNLENEVFFISDFFAVTNPDLVSLYVASDAVLYPSLQEGFGIPLLEAAVHRLPVFCNAIEPLKDLALSNVRFLDRASSPTELAATINRVISETANSRKDVMNRFSWEAIFANQIGPFLKKKPI